MAGSTSICLPNDLFRDRYQNGVSVSFLSRDPRNPSAGEIVQEMVAWETVFAVEVPAGTKDIAFRFLLRDPAGNVTYFPASGEFQAHSRRNAVLRFGGGDTEGEDGWPVEVLGLPSLERLLAYRRVIVPTEWKPVLQERLSAAGKTGLVEIVDPASLPSASPAASNDIERLKAGSLPASRVDLFLEEIRSGAIPVPALPDPMLIPDDPAFRAVRDAIQFQRLHEKRP